MSARDTPSAEIAQRALLDALAGAPDGCTRVELERRAGLTAVARATVLRWLNELIARGLVRAQGETKSRRYFLAARPPLADTTTAEETLPLSAEAANIRAQIRRPLGARAPTSYQRAFLDAYRPDETAYLPEATRRHLMNLGRTTTSPMPGGTYARQILQRLLIDLSWNSSRLEGNTYSLLDTERLLLDGTPAPGKEVPEKQMILNHKAAIEWIVEEVGAATPPRLVAPWLRNLHALLMENLLGDSADEGRIRARPVQIHSSTFIPLAVPQLLEECLSQVALVADAITDPFEQSFFLLVHLPYLQPFVDGNERTARLAANLPLIRDNLRPLTFVDVPERAFVDAVLAVYERRRVELLRDVYVWAYERSCARYAAVQQSLGEPDPFRLAHRALLKETVAELVRAGLGPLDFGDAVRPFAERLAPAERPRFLAVVEAELRNLNEGNFSRYRLRPSEYEAWAARVRRG